MKKELVTTGDGNENTLEMAAYALVEEGVAENDDERERRRALVGRDFG